MGEANLGYFTLDEDSDVEEFVADDPNFKKKAFWYDLVEKTIGSISRVNLILHALLCAFGIFLQWKLLITFINDGNWQYVGWTICIAALAGAANLFVAFSRRHTDTDSTAQFRRFSMKWKYMALILRQLSSFCLVVPLYNLFYYWTEASQNERDLKRPLVMRSQPQPTKQEIGSVQYAWEGVLQRSYLKLIEAFLKFIPFALFQLCILVHHIDKSPDSPEESPGQEIIGYLIFWSLLEISWSSTSYANAQFHYTKAVQFQDFREMGVPMHLLRVSYLNSGFHLLNNFLSSAFRLYCLALLLATVHYWVIPFIIGLFICFSYLVQCMPNRSRLRLENPPKGLSTIKSDLINRLMNFFCSVNIKQECFIHFTYIFALFYLIPRVWYLASEWSLMALEEQEFDSGNFSNYTRMELVDECTIEDMSVPLPIFDTIVAFIVHVIVYVTKTCSAQRKMLQNDLAVLLLLAVHSVVSLFYLAKVKSRILAETDFPVQIAQKYWTQWMNKEWDFNDIFEVKKILLCMVMSDKDLSSLANKTNWSCRWRFWVKSNNGPTSREALLSLLWEKYVGETNIVNVNQERLKLMLERRKKLQSNSKCDEALNRFLEFLWDNFVLEEDTVRMVLFAMEHFDEFIVKSSSLRLSQTQDVLDLKESIWK